MAYRLSGLAEQDLEEIWAYVAEHASSSAADQLVDAVVHQLERLVQQPRHS